MSRVFRTTEVSDPAYSADSLQFITVKSPALKRRADVCVYVPKTEAPVANIPVVVLLHGVYGSHWAWALKGGAHEVLQRLIDEGRVPPMALLMPSDGLWGDGSGYCPHSDADYESWIVDEVPVVGQENVEGITAESPVFIAGLSMGGYGALRLGAKYPDRFAGISGHSSITRLDQMTGFIEEDVASLDLDPEREGSVFHYLEKNKDRLSPLRFDCGRDDDLLAANQDLSRQLESAGIEHDYSEADGGHEWPYWHMQIEKTFLFFSQ